MLKDFGKLGKEHEFIIYHRGEFNPKLTPPEFKNYKIKKIPFPFLWTQLRFAFEIFRDKPDVLWMPVHNVPIFRRKSLKVVVTIHDLAFKIFPDYFPKDDLLKLNNYTNRAIMGSDKIIAVSQSTKKDVLNFYPNIDSDGIKVVYHGFDKNLFEKKLNPNFAVETLGEFKLVSKKYLLYVGAIQPRKDLITLIEAFDEIKKNFTDLKLVLAGAPAWHSEKTLNRISESKYKKDIIVTGTVSFDKLPVLYQNAAAFIFSSLYEGFGIPVLESMASGTPVILADNSSLLEVGNDAAIYFKTSNSNDLVGKLEMILGDKKLRDSFVEKGKIHSEDFSWEKCAKETLDILSKW